MHSQEVKAPFSLTRTAQRANETTMSRTKAAMSVDGPPVVAESGIAEPLSRTVLKCFQDTLTSSETANGNNNDRTLERYNTRSHGEKGFRFSLVCLHQYLSPAPSTPRRVLSMPAARSRERRIRVPWLWPRLQSGTNTLCSRVIFGV